MADEYIRKEDVLNLPQSIERNLRGEIVERSIDVKDIEVLEPVDVAPIVRCGQCGYWHSNDGDYGYCYAKDGHGFGYEWGKNDFCSYGERKE